MPKKIILVALLLLALSMNTWIRPSIGADTLTPNDFKQESFSKTVDFFDFARAYAVAAGKPIPPANWHAYLYQTYINVSGFQLYYSGLVNITAGQGALTIPVQSFMEHYRTPKGNDVLMSSSFIMLLTFNETATSRYLNYPDVNDILYASFSLGFDVANITGNTNKPALNSKTEVIELSHSSDKLEWNWGMRYTNLTALWWYININPANPGLKAVLPVAVTTYEELTFKYKLTISPTDHTAKIEASYVIGRMTNLWFIDKWVFFIPIVAHLNSTGTYRPDGAKISDETIYQFLERHHIKMSIVLFQNSLTLNYATESTFNNQNVTDAELDVSNGAISTEAANEKIFETNFGTKLPYKLYNYTADRTETQYEEYDSKTRTAPRAGFAKNPLFSLHVALLKYIPLIVQHIDPQLFQRAKDHMLNMTYADCFYITSYPTYSGFKIEHDPTYTAYIAPTATTGPLNLAGLVFLGVIIAAVIIGAIIVLKRRGAKTQTLKSTESMPPMPPAPSTDTN